jgi:8-oxo-dGTP pyrophosphatase MutT (NUDIX family)
MLINKVKLKLLGVDVLPGKDAQYIMAPGNRDISMKRVKPLYDKKSAVMVILYNDNGRAKTVLIKRAKYEGYHSGEVSFPGGKHEYNDKNMKQTAVRECFEEVGVKVLESDVILELTPLVIPKTGMEVFVFVAVLDYKPIFIKNDYEVNRIIETDLDLLFSDDTKKYDEIIDGNTIIRVPYYSVDNEKVWGATAMIISELENILI